MKHTRVPRTVRRDIWQLAIETSSIPSLHIFRSRIWNQIASRKNTPMKRNCFGQTFIVYCSKAATLQQKSNLFKLFSTDVSWWISLSFLNFIFHQLQITYNSITNFYPAFRTSFRLPSWWCHAFLQERIQKSSPRAGKKACAILKGRAQERCVSIHSRKKWR